MEKEFVTYEQALALKELGFDEPCLGYWRNEDLPNPLTLGQYTTKEDMEYEISGQDEYHNFKNIIALAPTYSAAFRWFREKHGLHVIIDEEIRPQIKDSNGKLLFEYTKDGKYAGFEYEEAELECLKKLIEITKNTNK